MLDDVTSMSKTLCSAKFVLLATMAKRLKLVMIDLSGTLHVEDERTPDAVEALQRLRQSDVAVRFVTNTTKESRGKLHARLQRLGFDVAVDEIVSSLWAARSLIETRKLRPLLLLDKQAEEDFEGLGAEDQKEGSDANSVLVGLAPARFSYSDLNNAFKVLNRGCPLVAVHEGRYYKRSDGLALGPGPFVRGLEYATGLKAEVVGKPSALFYQAALAGIPADEAIMIGDDVRDDVEGAQKVGIRSVLVQTGKYRSGDEETISPPPYLTTKNFASAVDQILSEDFMCRQIKGK